ncbi:uncharacterized protein C11orf52 homolog [Hippopotamus amphibius kiboko]|uniref:uncharacterized protein C11orf52 homolog n=1 Tax=Hippopotamus amphibius kiboko TaxID=575201 RepID=UPI002599DB6A|nr:uncharacterized protein C11orf52 homolog [Hippopotamus amphibius kiboko]
MGNLLGCGGSWSCPSTFQRKKKMGSQARRTLKQQQQKQQQQWQHNGAKGHDTTGHTYEQVLKQPTAQDRSQGLRLEESSLHYADIQLFSLTQPRSAQEVKHLQLENATEYATLCFPQATPRYDSKNGTLV